jgi:PucR family transcriptional regulator, purine catabolism regulatory protein
MTDRILESESMTVREALRIPALSSGRPEVVAGARGLDRTIRWAHAGEVANIADLLTGGELLLTTGLGIGATRPRQRRFAAELAQRGLAALVLELGGTHRRAPAALVESLEEHDLPLIVLHREVRFVDITEAIHRAILGRQLELLRRGEQTHRRFTALLLEGAGVPAVLEALATTVRNPVLLERDGEIVSHATYRGDGAAALAGWSTSGALTLPIPSGQGASWGNLVVPPHDSSLDDEARIAAERAVAVLAVGLLRDREQELLAVGEHGRFLATLAAGEIDAGAARLEADALGFHHDGEWLLPLALAPRRGTRASAGAWTAFCRALRDDLADRRILALVGADERTPAGAAALTVVGLSDPERRASALDQIARAVGAAADVTLGAPRGAVLAAGPALRGWADAGELLREAASAAALAVDDPPRPWHDASLPDLRHLLWELRDHASLRAFARRRLSEVLEHDARRPAAPLLPTLEALCDHGWSKAHAARALHLERQSIYPRIDRLERLLGADLADARQRAALDVAVLARRLAERPAR